MQDNIQCVQYVTQILQSWKTKNISFHIEGKKSTVQYQFHKALEWSKKIFQHKDCLNFPTRVDTLETNGKPESLSGEMKHTKN